MRAVRGLADERDVHEPGALLRSGGRHRGFQQPGRVLGRPDDRRGRRRGGVPRRGVSDERGPTARVAGREPRVRRGGVIDVLAAIDPACSCLC